ncbi:PHP-associated domain-containing protein [Butyrivibrio sp. VCD2006]|uniref:PHP-associated domain-containing protein n=1 Tax=Butyrivibrio sp. VCD2006 TaxID=1280664 RepID=UPI0003F5C0E9|nr:PHP-associated domain-containing protein [Butyrivibrio sp. VCD2006]
MEASKCSCTPGEDYIEYMLGLGYSGIIVTDHFFNGNSCVPKDLPWADRIEQYCSGYEHALAASKGTDLNVMFGVEFNFEGDEYLLYGIDKKWLLENEDIMVMSRKEIYDLVHMAGGMMIHAHPYRERGYLPNIHLTPSVCDGAEVYNSGNPDWQNALGYQYAKEHDFLMSAGSDIHQFPMLSMGGMSFPYKINSIQEYVKAFLAGDGTPMFRINPESKDTEFTPVEESELLTKVTKEHTLPIIMH